MNRHGTGNRPRTWISWTMLLAFGLLVGLLLSEAVVRALRLAPEVGLFTGSEREFQRIPGTFAPNQTSVQARGTRFEHTATINDLGYRGPTFPLVKPAGQLRVLFAGDSFTWGHNVEDHETLPAQLQTRLEAQCGPSVVANAGVAGTSILAHQAIIQRGLAIDPDVVVLMYHENDIDELIYSRLWDQITENRRIKSRFPLSVVYPLVRTSALWNLAQHVRRVFTFRDMDAARERVSEDGGGSVDEVDRARSEYRERLRAVRDELRVRDVPLAFVMFPHPESVIEGAGGRDYPFVFETAHELAVPTLDLLPRLREASLPVQEVYLVPEDYHPSSAGHALAARLLAGFIIEDLQPHQCRG